jgi:VanZ family protein
MAHVSIPDLTVSRVVSMPSPAEPQSGRTQYARRTRRRERPWLWFPVFLYAAAIFIVSGMSQPPLPGSVGDKWAHTAAYAGFALLTMRALAGGEWAGVTAGRCVMAVGLVVLYGAGDEVHQVFVPGRTADIRDLAADAAGATGGIAAMWLIARLTQSER